MFRANWTLAAMLFVVAAIFSLLPNAPPDDSIALHAQSNDWNAWRFARPARVVKVDFNYIFHEMNWLRSHMKKLALTQDKRPIAILTFIGEYTPGTSQDVSIATTSNVKMLCDNARSVTGAHLIFKENLTAEDAEKLADILFAIAYQRINDEIRVYCLENNIQLVLQSPSPPPTEFALYHNHTPRAEWRLRSIAGELTPANDVDVVLANLVAPHGFALRVPSMSELERKICGEGEPYDAGVDITDEIIDRINKDYAAVPPPPDLRFTQLNVEPVLPPMPLIHWLDGGIYKASANSNSPQLPIPGEEHPEAEEEISYGVGGRTIPYRLRAQHQPGDE